ncbi:MAG: exosortase [Phycisphaerales bacterium]|nr:MAG: exosortase [Phycisphaerales bacterium]
MDVLVLAGAVGVDAPWAYGIPRPLLPLPGSSVLEALLDKFQSAFDGACAICAHGNSELIARRLTIRGKGPSGRKPTMVVDSIPRGTAGCIKACETRFQGDAIFVTGASVWLDDDLPWMLEQHRKQGNALTVFCTRHSVRTESGAETQLMPIGVYCCDPCVLGLIPPQGYQDLKEQLVPTLRQAGLRVGAVTLPGNTCEVSSWPGYIQVLSQSLTAEELGGRGYDRIAPGIWCGEGVEIASRARIVGPTLIGHGCRVDDHATVIGPALLGDSCRLSEGSWVIRAVAPPGTFFAPGESVSDHIVPSNKAHRAGALARNDSDLPSIASEARRATSGSFRREGAHGQASAAGILIPAIGILAVFLWAFSHTFSQLRDVWQNSADYSVGQLVPLAAAYMIWTNREKLRDLKPTPAPIGLGVFVMGVLMSVAGSYLLYASLENLGMVVCANGLVLWLIGRAGYRQLAYPCLFLFLMLPLPGRVHDAVMLPLQGFCARASASVLEIGGVPVERYGHVLEVAGQQAAVAEACNGLRMAVAFVIVIAVVAYLIRRPTWQKVVVLVSAIPIAIVCNIARIVAMAYTYGAGYDFLVQGPLHDGAGILMMPLALAMVLLELWILSNVVVPREAGAPVDSSRRMAALSGR